MGDMANGQITCVRTDFTCGNCEADRTGACTDWRITDHLLHCFREGMEEKEKSSSTIRKYLRDLAHFRSWLKFTYSKDAVYVTEGVQGESVRGEPFLNKERVRQYKQYLRDNYKLSTANSMISSINSFFKYMGWHDCCITTFKVQRDTFRRSEKDLSVQEYQRILQAAAGRQGRGKQGGRQLALIMETLAGTGIRISELPFITVASLHTRRTAVSLKGKSRMILLPGQLCKKLLAYCRERAITEGSIFITRTGRPLDRTNILHRMKALSALSGVSREKIFPHNLRHLFAVTYYEKEKDIVRLADILGHSNINTTRIYTLVSCETQLDILDRICGMLDPV